MSTLCIDDSNYVELIILARQDANTHKEARLYNFDIPEDEFYARLKNIAKQKGIKYFVKRFKRYRVGDMVMELITTPDQGGNTSSCNVAGESRAVFRQASLTCCVVDDQLLGIGYTKEKIPLHQFPCTKNLHEVCYIQRLTFRLHNRVFLNFEIQKYMDEGKIHKIYINYNHDPAAERESMQSLLTEYVGALVSGCIV